MPSKLLSPIVAVLALIGVSLMLAIPALMIFLSSPCRRC